MILLRTFAIGGALTMTYSLAQLTRDHLSSITYWHCVGIIAALLTLAGVLVLVFDATKEHTP